MQNRNLILLLALAGSLVLASACGGKQNAGDGGSSTSEEAVGSTVDEGPAYVRFVHAAAGGNVDIHVDGQRQVQNLAQGAFNSTALQIPAGNHTVAIHAAGSGTAMASFPTDFAGGRNYTVALIGSEGAVEVEIAGGPRVAPASGTSSFRVIHAVPGANGASFRVEDGPSVASNLNFGQSTQFTQVPTSANRVQVIVGGEQIYSGPVPFNSGRQITTVVVPDGDGCRFINITDAVR